LRPISRSRDQACCKLHKWVDQIVELNIQGETLRIDDLARLFQCNRGYGLCIDDAILRKKAKCQFELDRTLCHEIL